MGKNKSTNKDKSMGKGVIIAAPSSGSGKTTVAIGLLRLLAREGSTVRCAKSGPDYIDSDFLEAACDAPCTNLDAWAMPPERLAAIAAGDGFLVVEGAMGLFDGAPPQGRGSTADLARSLGLPVVLVVDAARMAGSVTPLVEGFARHDDGVRVAGIVLNRVGGHRHEAILRKALEPAGIPVLAALHRRDGLEVRSRHLGLVQASEHPSPNTFADAAADALAATLDRDALANLAAELPNAPDGARRLPPPAQTIAVARDDAFAFAYHHMLEDWRAQGAQISMFSPLADEAVPEADMVFLPGGYPELHAGWIAAAGRFIDSLRLAAETSAIYGECGGYMVLGEGLEDAHGNRHRMAGLLRLETSFADPRLQLGYRTLTALGGPFSGRLAGHEFHYTETIAAKGRPLFEARDAEGAALPAMGLIRGRVCGSFAHVIDALPDAA